MLFELSSVFGSECAKHVGGVPHGEGVARLRPSTSSPVNVCHRRYLTICRVTRICHEASCSPDVDASAALARRAPISTGVHLHHKGSSPKGRFLRHEDLVRLGVMPSCANCVKYGGRRGECNGGLRFDESLGMRERLLVFVTRRCN